MINVTLYTKSDCSLCDAVKVDLAAIQADFPHEIIEINIEQDDALVSAFGTKVPVIEIGPYTREAPISRQDLIVTLGAAQHRVEQLEKVDDPKYEARKKRGQTLTKATVSAIGFQNAGSG